MSCPDCDRLRKDLEKERSHVWHLERIMHKVELLSIRLTPNQMASDTGPLLNEIESMLKTERQRRTYEDNVGVGLCCRLHKSGVRCVEEMFHKGPHRNGGLGWWEDK